MIFVHIFFYSSSIYKIKFECYFSSYTFSICSILSVAWVICLLYFFLFIYLLTRYQFISRKLIEANISISPGELYRILIYALASPLINHRIHWRRESRPIFNPHRWLHLIQMTRGIIWSTCVGVVKGLRVRWGQRALSRLLDRQEASFSRAHADKKEQCKCGSAVDTQMHPVPGWIYRRERGIFHWAIENKRTTAG